MGTEHETSEQVYSIGSRGVEAFRSHGYEVGGGIEGSLVDKRGTPIFNSVGFPN